MVAKFTQPNYTTQTAAAYKAAIDAAIAVLARSGQSFAAHEQDLGSPQPDMSVRLDAGFILLAGSLVEVDAQSVSGFTTPAAGQHRIDRVVVDQLTGVASRVAGTAAIGSPSATPPDIPVGKLPVCQVLLTDAATVITNSMITDERPMLWTPVSGMVKLTGGSVSNAATLDIAMTAYTAFKNKKLVLSNFLPATDNVILQMRVSTDGGGSYLATAIYDHINRAYATNTGLITTGTAAGSTVLSLTNAGAASEIGNAANEGTDIEITMPNMPSTAREPVFWWEGMYRSTAGAGIGVRGNGHVQATQDTDAIRILFSSGNIAAGDYALYGWT